MHVAERIAGAMVGSDASRAPTVGETPPFGGVFPPQAIRRVGECEPAPRRDVDKKGEDAMSEVSRRSFIKRSAAGVAGAAAIGALGAGPASAATNLASHTDADTGAVATSDEAVVAYVRPGSREVRVMKGEQEVVHRDAELVRRLLRAAK
jgi:hypothetical protein